MTRAGRAIAAALALVLMLSQLSGCALLRPSDDDAGKPAEAPALPPPVQLVVEAPTSALRTLLETHLDIARLRRVAPTETISDQELRRLEAAAPAQARALLETEGYFNADVTLSREPGTPPVVRVRVEPGPQARVDTFDLKVQGTLAQPAPADVAHAREVREGIDERWPLTPGTPFRNDVWGGAKTGAVAGVRAGGYAAATLAHSEAVVDAEAHRARLGITIDSGPLFRIGRLDIQGLDRQSPKTVRNLADDVQRGAVATEEVLLDFQDRLQRANLYQSASVSLDSDPAQADAATLTVRVREMALQQATVGVGVSDVSGARVSLEHLHRMPFGQRATWRNKIEFGQLRQAWEGELGSQTLPRLWRNLFGYAVERQESDVDTVMSGRVSVGRSQERRETQRLVFVQAERAQVKNSAGTERADALSLNAHGVWRKVDSLLLPTEGTSLALQGGVGVARSSHADDGPFTRLYARLYHWRPIGSWYTQARLEAGQVFARRGVLVPDTQRFRAGGDDSVRGYAIRTLGPQVNGQVESGNVLMTASVELARPILERLPQLWGAVFIDAGNAAEHWKDLKPVWGAGVGVRFRSPVGPLRLDLAYGDELKSWRMHLSMGVAF